MLYGELVNIFHIILGPFHCPYTDPEHADQARTF